MTTWSDQTALERVLILPGLPLGFVGSHTSMMEESLALATSPLGSMQRAFTSCLFASNLVKSGWPSPNTARRISADELCLGSFCCRKQERFSSQLEDLLINRDYEPLSRARGYRCADYRFAPRCQEGVHYRHQCCTLAPVILLDN